jgi:hypothetical protein
MGNIITVGPNNVITISGKFRQKYGGGSGPLDFPCCVIVGCGFRRL